MVALCTTYLARKAHRIFNSKFIHSLVNYYYHYSYFNIQLLLLTPSCLHSLVVGLAALGFVSMQLTLPPSLLSVVKPGAAIGVLHLF